MCAVAPSPCDAESRPPRGSTTSSSAHPTRAGAAMSARSAGSAPSPSAGCGPPITPASWPSWTDRADAASSSRDAAAGSSLAAARVRVQELAAAVSERFGRDAVGLRELLDTQCNRPDNAAELAADPTPWISWRRPRCSSLELLGCRPASSAGRLPRVLAGDHDRPDRRIAGDLVEAILKLHVEAGAESVEPLRTRERERHPSSRQSLRTSVRSSSPPILRRSL